MQKYRAPKLQQHIMFIYIYQLLGFTTAIHTRNIHIYEHWLNVYKQLQRLKIVNETIFAFQWRTYFDKSCIIHIILGTLRMFQLYRCRSACNIVLNCNPYIVDRIIQHQVLVLAHWGLRDSLWYRRERWSGKIKISTLSNVQTGQDDNPLENENYFRVLARIHWHRLCCRH